MAVGAMLLVFIAYLVLNHRKKRNISALLHRQKEALLQNEMKIERQKMVEV